MCVAHDTLILNETICPHSGLLVSKLLEDDFISRFIALLLIYHVVGWWSGGCDSER